MNHIGPFKCDECHKEFLTAYALGEHTSAKHEDVWDRASHTGAAVFIPETPGGTILVELAANTEKEAIANLLRDAAHMPYDGWDSPEGYGFKQRGYTICKAVMTEESMSEQEK